MSTLKIKRENGKIFCPLADSWHIETPEEKVRQEYIKILVEDYGYSLDQMAQEIIVNLFILLSNHIYWQQHTAKEHSQENIFPYVFPYICYNAARHDVDNRE